MFKTQADTPEERDWLWNDLRSWWEVLCYTLNSKYEAKLEFSTVNIKIQSYLESWGWAMARCCVLDFSAGPWWPNCQTVPPWNCLDLCSLWPISLKMYTLYNFQLGFGAIRQWFEMMSQNLTEWLTEWRTAWNARVAIRN